MPFWLPIAIRLLLRVAMPWLQAHAPKEIVDLIKKIIDYVLNSDDQVKAAKEVKAHCEGLFCPADTLK